MLLKSRNDRLLPVPTPDPVYIRLRDAILHLSPGEIGLAPSPGGVNVWGVMMEMGFENAAVTLVSLADGTTSLYFGNGGGFIGGGEHAPVAEATCNFVAEAGGCLPEMDLAEDFPLPCVGRVKFYTLTFDGILTADVGEAELAAGSHSLSGLFYSGQKVITELRLLQEPTSPG